MVSAQGLERRTMGNGYIDIRSAEWEGTTVRLHFPVTRRQAERQKSMTPLKDYTGRGEKILVVDDVPEQREIVTMLLSRLGYAVNNVSSGEEAVEFMKSKPVDLVVLDMIMEPRIDGLETYRRILEVRPGTRAIIASGFSETDRVKEAQKLGAGSYVKKPYTLEKIGLAIKAELSWC
jgi:CheY-like chemotaxis protein